MKWRVNIAVIFLRGGHGLESRWSPDFFRLLLSNCLNWKIYCDDHSSTSLFLFYFTGLNLVLNQNHKDFSTHQNTSEYFDRTKPKYWGILDHNYTFVKNLVILICINKSLGQFPIDQFRYIKIQPQTIDLSTRL